LGTKIEVDGTFVRGGKYRKRRGDWELLTWETALPSRLKVKLPSDFPQQLEMTRTTYHRFGQYSVRCRSSASGLASKPRATPGQYGEGGVVRYTRGSKCWASIQENTRVWSRWTCKKTASQIERENGEHQGYAPRRLAGAAVYHEVERVFSEVPAAPQPNSSMGVRVKIAEAAFRSPSRASRSVLPCAFCTLSFGYRWLKA
jgi:hypothetical protein